MGFLKWLGDYAGYAQEYFQEDHPGATAMFMMGCGADQNPYPRSQLQYAQRHGRSLATAVEAALEVGQKTLLHQRPLHGPLRSAMETVDLEFDEPDRPDFPYPVHVVCFGNDLCIVALGTEVVIDYSLRIKRELTEPDGPAIWVAGYSNVYAGYIPSRRVLLEGGYEAKSRPWKPTLEERIVGKVHELFDRLNREPQRIRGGGGGFGGSPAPEKSPRTSAPAAGDSRSSVTDTSSTRSHRAGADQHSTLPSFSDRYTFPLAAIIPSKTGQALSWYSESFFPSAAETAQSFALRRPSQAA
jgi:hypothetical protein